MEKPHRGLSGRPRPRLPGGLETSLPGQPSFRWPLRHGHSFINTLQKGFAIPLSNMSCFHIFSLFFSPTPKHLHLVFKRNYISLFYNLIMNSYCGFFQLKKGTEYNKFLFEWNSKVYCRGSDLRDDGGGLCQASGAPAFLRVKPTGGIALIPACAALWAFLGSGQYLFSEWPRAFQFCPLQEVDLLLTTLRNT